MEPSGDKVVARYADGRVVKGCSEDFHPDEPCFHLATAAHQSVEIALDDLKAAFFVRDFAGQPEYTERRRFTATEVARGRRVAVTFADGEILVGTLSDGNYAPERVGFFLQPADARSNNIRVFAVTRSVKDVFFL